MTVLNLLAPSISGSYQFHNLALFICHLFIDGEFRTTHILHNQNIFDDRIFFEVQSNCPDPIPWLMTDITRPISFAWTSNDPIDHILQVIFFDPDNLPTSADNLTNVFAYYRLFVLSATDEVEVKHQITTLIKVEATSNSSSLIIHQSKNDGLVCVHSIQPRGESSEISEPSERSEHSENQRDISVAQSRTTDLKNKNLFELTFGKNEQAWMTVINHHVFRNRDNTKKELIHATWNGVPYSINYYQASLHAAFINLTSQFFGSPVLRHDLVHQKPRRSYKELTTQYNPIEKPNVLEEDRSKVVNMYLNFFNTETSLVPLYPYHTKDLVVLFVYGDDFKRRKSSSILNNFGSLLFNWFNLCMFIGAAMLCALRRVIKLQHDGFFSCFIDVLITFTGGGNLRINDHRFEKWFFGIVFVTSIFLNAIGLESSLFPSYVDSERRINTFEKLAKINPPIYVPSTFKGDFDIIFTMLKNKIGYNIQMPDIEYLPNIILQHKISFAYVTTLSWMDINKKAIKGVREFDVLKERLGSLQVKHYLKSDQYIPERVRSTFDKKTILMIENGLNQFFESYTQLLNELSDNELSHEDSEYGDDADLMNALIAINDDVTTSMTLFLCFISISCLIFLVEIIVFKLKERRILRNFVYYP